MKKFRSIVLAVCSLSLLLAFHDIAAGGKVKSFLDGYSDRTYIEIEAERAVLLALGSVLQNKRDIAPDSVVRVYLKATILESPRVFQNEMSLKEGA